MIHKEIGGRQHTVWILGAGFSRDLGLPLYKDLLKRNLVDDLVKEYGKMAADLWLLDEAERDAATAIIDLYHFGRPADSHAALPCKPGRLSALLKQQIRTLAGEFWSDAEEFFLVLSD